MLPPLYVGRTTLQLEMTNYRKVKFKKLPTLKYYSSVLQMITSRSWCVSLMLTDDGNAVNQLIDLALLRVNINLIFFLYL